MIRFTVVLGVLAAGAASASAASCSLVPYDYKALRDALSLSSNAEVDQRMADLGKTDPSELGRLCETRREIMRVSDPKRQSLAVPAILDQDNPYLSRGEKVAVKRKRVAEKMNKTLGM